MSVQSSASMTSLERVLAAMSFREPDRVPFFLLLTTHGARELGMSIKDYFADPEACAEAQFRMRQRYGHDCYYSFSYASLEIEAWGGSTDFSDDGPPNAGPPIIRRVEEIDRLAPPSIESSPGLTDNLKTIALLKHRAGSEVPIIGVVMSPFSLPVMQLGFAAYLDLIHEDTERFNRLMKVNTEFCVAWGNAQLAAGATAICYFDPLASPDFVPLGFYRDTGKKIAREAIARMAGPTAIHLASGRSLGLIDDLVQTKTAIVGFSAMESLAEAKKACAGKLTILGNLNSIVMRRWTPADAEREVKTAIAQAGRGGGFILSDNHGEIHWTAPEATLDAISAAVHSWGTYPLAWTG